MEETKAKHTIIKNIISYSVSRYLAQVLNFFTAVLMRKFLGPLYIGMWNLLKVVRDYAVYTDLGTTETVSYKVPFLNAKKKLSDVQEIKNTVFSFVILGTILSSLIIFAYAIICRKKLYPEMFYGLIMLSLILFFQRIYTYYLILLRANKNINILSKSVVFDSIINICMILFIVKNYKIYGLYLGMALLPLLNIFFIRYHIKYNLRFSFRMPGILSYIKFGLPLFLSGLLQNVLNNVDKIMIAAMLGLKPLGFYSIGLMARDYSQEISKNFSHIITPYFFEDYGRNENRDRIYKYMVIVILSTSCLMAILLSSVFICAPPFIIYVLPKFIPGIPAMKIFLLTTFFTSLYAYFADYFVALNKQSKLIVVSIFAILMNIILNYLFIKLGFNIEGVALATAVVGFLSFCIALVYIMKHFEGILGIITFFLKTITPLLYSLIMLGVLERLINFRNIMMEAAIQLFLFLISFLPILYFFNKETNLITTLFKMIKRVKSSN